MSITPEVKQRIMAIVPDDEGNYYYNGPLDGIWGPESQKAAQRFAEDFLAPENSPNGLWDGIKYFAPKEFACKCGKYCNGFPVQPNRLLLELSDDVREHFDKPMIVSSGVRCEKHNANVGGVSGSRHKLGKAIDFCLPGLTSAQILSHVNEDIRVRYAYAIDDSYVHMDVE